MGKELIILEIASTDLLLELKTSLRVTGEKTEIVLSTCGQNLDLAVMKLFQILQFLMVLYPLEFLPLSKVEPILNLWPNKKRRESRNTRK